jgi:hypothetical protein
VIDMHRSGGNGAIAGSGADGALTSRHPAAAKLINVLGFDN